MPGQGVDCSILDPNSIFTDVLLPAPFGPRKPKTSPRGTSRVRFRTATFPSKTLRSPRIWMARSEDGVIYRRIIVMKQPRPEHQMNCHARPGSGLLHS